VGLSLAADDNFRPAKNLILGDDIEIHKPGIEKALRFELLVASL
jgi:hypothetical protein